MPWAIALALFVALGAALWPSEPEPGPAPAVLAQAPRDPPPILPAMAEAPLEELAEPEPAAADEAAAEPNVAEPNAAPSTPRPNAALTVNASPWAEVRIDGRLLGRTPQRRVSVRPGPHVLELRCPPLGREVRHPFEAEPGRALTLVADLTADPPVVRER